MEFSIKFDDKEVKKTLSKLEGGLKDYQKPLETIGTTLIDIYGTKVFKTQGRELGTPWKNLSASTLEARARRTGYYANPPKETGKILIWTGRLQESFRKKAERLRLTVDNTDKKFRKHQLGEGRTPQRPMLGLTKSIIATIVDDLNNYIKKLIQ